jgi:hypothetical protein
MRFNRCEGSFDLGGWQAGGSGWNTLGILNLWENGALLLNSRATLSGLRLDDTIRWAIASTLVYTCKGNGAEGAISLGRARLAFLETFAR